VIYITSLAANEKSSVALSGTVLIFFINRFTHFRGAAKEKNFCRKELPLTLPLLLQSLPLTVPLKRLKQIDKNNLKNNN
jgi:hypothetical protein